MNSLFTRVFIWFWIAVALIAGGVAGITALNFSFSHEDPVYITHQAERQLEQGGIEALRVWLAERNRANPGQHTFIIDERGEDILGQRRIGGGPRPPDEGQHAFGPAPRMHEREVPAQRHWGERLAPPRSTIHGADGSAYRVMFDPPPRRGPFSPPYSWSERVVLFGLGFWVITLVSYLLARSISKPVHSLQSTARQWSSGNLEVRAGPAVVGRKDEIGTLGREFDAMAERVGMLIAARQRLLRDISHELRSPLARMEMALSLARQDPSSTPDQLSRLEREAARLQRLISNILEYARLDRDPSTLALEDVDMVELVRQIVHDAEFENQSPPGRIALSHDSIVSLRADAQVLHAAIDNIVRNAFIHGSERAAIEVDLSAAVDEVRITVRDYGDGVPEGDLERIFEPFYRSARSDAGHHLVDAAGVGLAVAARAAALHGGCVAAHNAEGGGLAVTIVLPMRSVMGAA